jgi:MoCo/4Fe-4S cofactor protein with predicted Tat translocation signal
MKQAEAGGNMDEATPHSEAKIGAQKAHSGGSFIPLATVRPAAKPRLDLATIRERLAGARGQQYWRSLDELAETEEFQRYLEREFPMQAPRDMEPISRREFFRVMGATMALAGVAGCSYQPAEHIVPYVEQPEELVPGKPLFYTSAFQRGGYALGVLGESHMGRPVKIEGNLQHPASRGATDVFAQASLLGLYDPDRSQAVRHLGNLTTWDTFLGVMTDQVQRLRQQGGAGLRVLIETVTSPTLAAQLRRLLARYPNARIHHHEPAGQQNVHAGLRLAFNADMHPVYHFDHAQRILALDADFLSEEPGSVRYARDFIAGRLVREGRSQMNRLYVAESTPTITGAKADHRVTVRPSQIEAVARAVAGKVGVAGVSGETPQGVSEEWLTAVANDLKANRGASLVIAGASQPPAVHALAHAMNSALGAAGQTVTYTAPVEARFPGREGSLRELVDDITAGRVKTLVILSANPVYTAPADVKIADALPRVPNIIHLGLYDDETAALCHWHLPESHYLESWGDARAYDGTASIIQPLIRPLYATHSAHELLAVLLGEGDRAGYDIVREYWMGTQAGFAPAVSNREPGSTITESTAASAGAPGSPAFEQFWHKVLLDGVLPGTQAPARPSALRADFAAALGQASSASGGEGASAGGLEIGFRPDPCIWDGRYANNGWLQELPKPLNQLTWDNAAFIGPNTALKQGLHAEDLVELTYRERSLRVPVWVQPGVPDDTVTLHLGYGRERAGRVGTGPGFNAYTLRTADAPGFATGVTMRKVGGIYDLVSAQHHFSMHGRDFVRTGTLAELTADPKAPAFMHPHGEAEEEPLHSLYKQRWPSDRPKNETGGAPAEQQAGGAGSAEAPMAWETKGYNAEPIPAWGMVIDLNACIGCNACVIGCQSENNIATVGKAQVGMNREMHWIRLDAYYRVNGVDGQDEPERSAEALQGNLEMAFQPVPCMQCENAPCEPVCPVEATTHSAEGLNEQTYNRCVGTRYCQNNCPWKVRRFNYFQFSDQKTPTIQMMMNPDVTVRSRGVMEKCTYCVQRINEARIQAEREERPIGDGDIRTACQQVCPTQAIIFGNLNDRTSHGGRGSRVRQLKEEALNYTTLKELNTLPRTSYLANMRNPNPELERATPAAGESGG